MCSVFCFICCQCLRKNGLMGESGELSFCGLTMGGRVMVVKYTMERYMVREC